MLLTKKKSMFFTVIFIFSFFNAYTVGETYFDGNGEPNDPYQIADYNDLMLFASDSNNYDKNFILIADIDMDPNLPGRKIFDTAVVASDGEIFTGVFDGAGHAISNLKIDDGGANKNRLGLFERLDEAEIKNLNIVNINIVSGYHYIGGLAGSCSYSDINDCSVTGNISGSGNYIGGLIGSGGNNLVNNCHVEGYISGNSSVGGLFGSFSGTINNCYSKVTVLGTLGTGGLIGHTSYTNDVNNCYSESYVSGANRSGGLIGDCFYGTIVNCYSVSTVAGATDVGGLIGYTNIESSITNCHSKSVVSGTSEVGGLIGEFSGTISNCYSVSTVSGTGASIGGLIGISRDSIISCYAKADVNGYSNVGGLAGYDYDLMCGVIDCYAKGSVTGNTNVGGLLGRKSGNCLNCYSAVAVVGVSDVGGFVGENLNNFVACLWDGTLNPGLLDTGDDGDRPGVEAKSTTEMKLENTYTSLGWDFIDEVINGTDDIWSICEVSNYPRLVWQIPSGDFLCPDGVNFYEFTVLANAWLSTLSDDSWNPICDLYPDDVIDNLDLKILVEHWLQE